ncbi:MAG: anti-sigma factor antagonist [Gemmataceae bacterium]|nr:anti-sigma factor antagonist [Gemmataceae bacterium]
MPFHAQELQIEVTRDGNRSVVRFLHCDSLNEYNADRVGQLMSELAVGHADQQVVLDMSTIQYLTSTILGHMMALHKKLRASGGRLRLENVLPAVRNVFHATLLDQVLDIQVAGAVA